MEIVTKLRVEEDAIDVLGHVNNTVYLTYLEEARTDWYARAAQFSEEENLKNGVSTVILHIDIWFKQEALLGDELTITTKPERLGNTSFTVKQKIFNQRKELVTEATVTSVMFNVEKRKSIPVVDGIARLYK